MPRLTLRGQLIREQIGRIKMLFLTYQHFDHSGGTGEVESYADPLLMRAVPA